MTDDKYEAQGNVWGTRGTFEPLVIGTAHVEVLARLKGDVDSKLVAERIHAIIEGRPDRTTPADDIDMREKALDLAVLHGHKDDDDARIVARADAFYQFLTRR